MTGAPAARRILRRDRAMVAAALVAVVLVAWTYLVRTSSGLDMTGMEHMAMPHPVAWSAVDLVLLFVMWAVMMVAMMLPSAAPMIMLFAGVQRRRMERRAPYTRTAVFVLGYVLVWSGYAVVAALAQWGLHQAALLSPMMVSTSAVMGGVLLVAAGLFQFTPLKHRCLAHCRSPLGFLTAEWREGARGALWMGSRHGAYCVGCCWMVMTLLFVVGVMNLLWISALAGFVLVEKVLPEGQWVSRVAGVLLIGWGAWMVGAFVG